MLAKDSRLLVAAFYAFTPLDDERRETLLSSLPSLAREGSVLGSVLVAHEGVNGTISGQSTALMRCWITCASLDLGDDHYARLEVKRSWAEKPVFRRFKARRKEIVTIGVASVDPSASVGTYVEPEHWNALVDDPDTLVIDTRNSYETAIGSFEGAIDPSTSASATSHGRVHAAAPDRRAGQQAHRRIPHQRSAAKKPAATCSNRVSGRCTTCAAASSSTSSRCRAKPLARGVLCFDQRVALNHRLEPGEHSLCHACGLPVSAQQRELPSYIKGCSACTAWIASAMPTRNASPCVSVRSIKARLINARSTNTTSTSSRPEQSVRIGQSLPGPPRCRAADPLQPDAALRHARPLGSAGSSCWFSGGRSH